jgi:hypothetical protein
VAESLIQRLTHMRLLMYVSFLKQPKAHSPPPPTLTRLRFESSHTHSVSSHRPPSRRQNQTLSLLETSSASASSNAGRQENAKLFHACADLPVSTFLLLTTTVSKCGYGTLNLCLSYFCNVSIVLGPDS